jgi:hypothetical protein
MSISLIVMGVATAMLLSGTNMAQHTTQRALEEQIVDGVFDYAQDRLLFATAVEMKSSADLTTSLGGDADLLYISTGAGTAALTQGALFYRDTSNSSNPNPLNVMGNDFYMGYTVSLEAKLSTEGGKKPVVFIKVKLHNKTNQVVAERERTITLINGTPSEGAAGRETIPMTAGGFLSIT